MWLSGEVRDTYGEEKQKLIETMERGAGKDWRKSDYAVKQVNRAAVLCVINRLFWESVKDK